MTTLRSETNAEAVARLHGAGWSAVKIANALGMSPQGVYYHLRKLELPNPSERRKP